MKFTYFAQFQCTLISVVHYILIVTILQVRVQLVVRLANNDTISHGDEFWLGASTNLNNFNSYYLDTRFYADQNVIASEVRIYTLFSKVLFIQIPLKHKCVGYFCID